MLIDSQIQEHSTIFQMPRWQLVLQIGELGWLTIRSESQCERDQEQSITSDGKNWIQFERNLPTVTKTVTKECVKCSKTLTPEDMSTFFLMD